MDQHPVYQVAVHTGENRLYHPANTWQEAIGYASRVEDQADYIAVERWVDTANSFTGGWVIAEIVRDTTGHMAFIADVLGA